VTLSPPRAYLFFVGLRATPYGFWALRICYVRRAPLKHRVAPRTYRAAHFRLRVWTLVHCRAGRVDVGGYPLLPIRCQFGPIPVTFAPTTAENTGAFIGLLPDAH